MNRVCLLVANNGLISQWLIITYSNSVWLTKINTPGLWLFTFCFQTLFVTPFFLVSFMTDSQPGKSNGEAPGPEPIRATGAPGQPWEGGVYGSRVWRGKKNKQIMLHFPLGFHFWKAAFSGFQRDWALRWKAFVTSQGIDLKVLSLPVYVKSKTPNHPKLPLM